MASHCANDPNARWAAAQLKKMSWVGLHATLDSLARNRPQTFARIVQHLDPVECLYGQNTAVPSDGSVIILKDLPKKHKAQKTSSKKTSPQTTLHDYFSKKKAKRPVTLHKYFALKCVTLGDNA